MRSGHGLAAVVDDDALVFDSDDRFHQLARVPGVNWLPALSDWTAKGMTSASSVCDPLEVRWLLSEQAGRDVGAAAAVHVLAQGSVPAGAAAEFGVRKPWGAGCPTRSTGEQRRTA